MHSFLYNEFPKVASFLFELFSLCLYLFNNVFAILFPLEYSHYVSITFKLFFQPLSLCLSSRFSSCLDSTNCVLINILPFVSFHNVWVLLVAFQLLSLHSTSFHYVWASFIISQILFCLLIPFIVFGLLSYNLVLFIMFQLFSLCISYFLIFSLPFCFLTCIFQFFFCLLTPLRIF